MNPILLTLLLTLASVLLLFISIGSIRIALLYQPPRNNLEWFLRQREQKPEKIRNRKTILFLGDSITHARVSANYILPIRKSLAKKEFTLINGGFNGNSTFDILEQIDSVVKAAPDVIFILIGTNDANYSSIVKTNNPLYKKYRKYKIPNRPTEELYQENIHKILSRLQEETNAKIAICSIPPIGENPEDHPYQESLIFSQIVKQLAQEQGVSYLPLNEVMLEALDNHIPSKKVAFTEQLLKWFVFMNKFFGVGFNQLGKSLDFLLHADHLHLNSRGAQLVAELMIDFLRKHYPNKVVSS